MDKEPSYGKIDNKKCGDTIATAAQVWEYWWNKWNGRFSVLFDSR